MEIVTAKEMMTFDQKLLDQGYSSEILMENAGSAFVEASIDYLKTIPRHILVFCGPGNNGGDGMVIARKFMILGSEVKIIFCCCPLTYQGAAKMNYELLTGLKANTVILTEDTLDDVYKMLQEPGIDLVVDAIFGIGLKRSVKSMVSNVVDMMNSIGSPIGSVDIASGIDATNGKVRDKSVRSNFCVVVGLLKVGNLLYNGYTQCGKIYYSSISSPYQGLTTKCHLNSLLPLPPRSISGHKNTFGQALFVAGAKNYFGAPHFSCSAFLLSGGGYARLATISSVCPVIAGLSPEIVFIPLIEIDGYIAPENAESLRQVANTLDIICLGPGISTNSCVSTFVQQFLPHIDKPVVLDGDALSIVAKDLSVIEKHTNPLVLTPHIGEFSRLISKPVEVILENRIPLLQEYAKKWNAIIVLKDARTVIAEPGGNCWINTSGNDGLAKAGSGDVLVGIICALACQNHSLLDAVRNAVFLHGFAADLAAVACGKDSLTATKLLEYIPKALQLVRKNPTHYSHYNIQCLC